MHHIDDIDAQFEETLQRDAVFFLDYGKNDMLIKQLVSVKSSGLFLG